MYTVVRLPEFDEWLAGQPDRLTRLRLARRLEKVAAGNLGDVAPVGDGVHEMREHFGPGWRMYYVVRGAVVVVMLGGGSKRTQRADIAAARLMATLLED